MSIDGYGTGWDHSFTRVDVFPLFKVCQKFIIDEMNIAAGFSSNVYP